MPIELKAQRIALLQRMPLFGALREDALHRLLDEARILEVPVGAYFFREGDQAQAMYVLERGQAAVLKNWEGAEYLVRHFHAGDCLGEMALMDLFPRSASVRAVQPCSAIEISPEDLLRLAQHDMEQFALIQMNLGREVCRRLRATDELLFACQRRGIEPAHTTLFQSH